jgi:hypothetical protein
MDPRFRPLFNAAFSEDLYGRYSAALKRRVGEIPFPLAETPVFVPEDVRDRFARTAREILAQLHAPETTAALRRAVPPEFDTPGMDALPSFVQVDLALTRDRSGAIVPKLIELQGLPSLTAFEVFQRDAWAEILEGIPGLHRDWSPWFSGLDRQGFLELARRTIVGRHDPEQVVLLDIDPPTQKTRPDFVATQQLFGVDPVCVSDLVKRGGRLFRMKDGREIPVARIYNRIVFDELRQKQPAMAFDYREPLDVEWTPHPNWYWMWSKYTLPFLDHPDVPRARLVSELREIPADLSRYVLKPLFSFAGAGVNVDPTPADIDAIPDAERGNWCLQEKIEYEPVIPAADGGGVKCELRVMCLKPDGAREHVPAQNLCRLSRGKMLGVDFNKSYTWVGSSVALWPS